MAVWRMFTHGVEYTDPGSGQILERTGRTRQPRGLVSQVNQLGYQVTLDSGRE
ncbi:hypothetical protein [Streptomyces sp. NPDC001678]|uniref:hypothetical protein n=1 Tax=Streptomyces sp. NPDC001678 TaxID=3364599 RepID=UPI0036A8BAEC